MGRPIIWNGANAKLINSGDLIDSNANSLTNGGKANYTWTSHGLTVGGTADLGRPVYLVNATTLAFADQTTSANAEVLGFLYAVLDSVTVRVSFAGNIPTVGSNFLEGGGFLVPGTVYFLSATAGKVTATEPTTVGYVSKPLGVAASTTRFTAFNMRGSVVGSANARTQITLANNATTPVQNVSLYDAGSIEGWVYIDAPTDVRFYVKAPFSKYGAAADYYISPSYVGDTPPAGYSMTVTAAGLIQITLPNIASFTSAVINFALNAPAVGTNFPLNLDSANLTNSGITGLTGTAATAAVTSGSGKVGERYLFTFANTSVSTASPVTGTWYTASTLFTLNAGIWLLTMDSIVTEVQGTTPNARVQIAFCNSTPSPLVGYAGFLATASISYTSLSTSCLINLSSSTTIVLGYRVASIVSGTVTQLNFRNDYGGGGNTATAIHIA